MTVRRRVPFELPDGRSYIIRVRPLDEWIPDLFEPLTHDHDLPIWLVSEALNDRVYRQVIGVHRHIARWRPVFGMDPSLAILWALWNPASPFGWAFQPTVPFASDKQMLMIFQGRFYTRDRRGVLTPNGDKRVVCWPDSNQFADIIAQVVQDPWS